LVTSWSCRWSCAIWTRRSSGSRSSSACASTGIGHIELLQPTDPDKAVGRFLAKHGEGVYLVGFE